MNISFKAVINSLPRYNAWSRGIQMLSTIQEKINITITEHELILWAFHGTETTLCQLTYEKDFFAEYQFQPYNIVFGEDGLQTVSDVHGIDHKLYSLEINAKNLTLVSRKSDKDDEVKDYMLIIDNTTTCPDSLMNILLVTISTDSQIVKEHSLLFTPVKYTSNRLDLQYKKKFLNIFGGSVYDHEANNRTFDPALVTLFHNIDAELTQSLFQQSISNVQVKSSSEMFTEEDEINYISCNLALIKNFIDNCNVSVVKDVNLQLYQNFLRITASRNDLKNTADLLQRGFIISNTIDTNDLGPRCIYKMQDESQQKNADSEDRRKGKSSRPKLSKEIIFTLNDFKNFINITQSWKNITENEKIDTPNEKNVGIWFCRPGERILFEISISGIRAQLLLITDGSGTSIDQSINTSLTVVNKQVNIPSPQRGKKSKVSNDDSQLIKTTSTFRLDDDYDNVPKFRMPNPLEIRDNRISPLKVTKSPISRRGSPLRNNSILGSKASPRRLFVRENSEEGNSLHRPELAGPVPSLSRKTSSNLSVTRSPRRETEYERQQKRQRESNKSLKRTETIVGWGHKEMPRPVSRQSSMEEDEADRKRILKEEKLKYLHSEAKKDGKQLASRTSSTNKSSDQNNILNDDDEFGPTQYVRVKGLFD